MDVVTFNASRAVFTRLISGALGGKTYLKMTQVMWPHLSWPAAVGSGLLYIVMHGDPDKTGLKRVMEPILRKLGPASFDCVDGKLAWSAKRPVWFQAIVDLLEPYFVPILGGHNWSMYLCLNVQISVRWVAGGHYRGEMRGGGQRQEDITAVAWGQSKMQTCHDQVQSPRDHKMCMYQIKSNISLTLNPVSVSVLLSGQDD